MKTERRHELETNELARRLARSIETVKPYSKAVLGLVVAGVVIGAAWMLLGQRTTKSEAAAWNDYWMATLGGRLKPEDLLDVADDHQGTSAEDWARLAAADVELDIGVRTLFRNKEEGRRRLRNAEDLYTKLRQAAGLEAVRQRAAYGLGRTREALGDLDKACATYEEVGGAFEAIARRRAEFLKRSEVKSFCDWFADAEPPAPKLLDEPGTPGSRPDRSIKGLGDFDLSAPVKPSAKADAPIDQPPAGSEPAQP